MSVYYKIIAAFVALFLCGCAGPGNYSKTYRQTVSAIDASGAFMAEPAKESKGKRKQNKKMKEQKRGAKATRGLADQSSRPSSVLAHVIC